MMPPDDPAEAAAEAAIARRKAATATSISATPDVVDPAEEAANQALARRQKPAAAEAAPPTDWGGTIKELGHQAYQGAIEGGAGLIGAPAGILHGVNRLLGLHPPVEDPALGLTNYLTPSYLLGGAQKNFLGYDPTQPTTLSGELARGAGRATASLPLSVGMGPAGALAYTYGPSAVGDIVHHYAPTINPLWAALPTALTMSGAERYMTEWGAKSAAQQAAEQAAREQAEATAAQAAYQAKQPAASELATSQRQGAANVRAGFKEASEADIGKMHDSEYVGADMDREAVASKFGQSKTVQDSGEALQDTARSWKKDEFPKQLKDAEKNMYDGIVKIPEDALGDLSNFRESIKNSFYRAGELELAAQQIKSRMPERLEAALDEIAAKQGLKPGEIPQAQLGDMKKLRSILGDAMSSPKLLEGVNAGQMNELYRALSSDMEGAIKNAAGLQGVAQFKKFNEEARRLYGLASGPVSKIISTTDKAGETIRPGEAVTSVLKGSDKDGTLLTQLGSEPTLKKGLNEVAASQLRTGKPDEFYSGLAPEAQKALYGNEAPNIQATIDRRAEADQRRDQMMEDIPGKAKAMKQTEDTYQARQTRIRRDEGTALGQAVDARTAALEEAKAKLKGITTPPPASWENIPWGKILAGLGGYTAGHHLLPSQIAAHMPNWGERAADVGTAAASLLAAKGAHEIWVNPRARRNLLQAGAAAGTSQANTKAPTQ